MAIENTKTRNHWLAVVVCLVGLLALFHPMILSGFSRMQRDLGDTRLNNYFLEHTWLWLKRDPLHSVFLDSPFFYPAKGVGAYTELALGAAPIYWIFRVIGLEPDSSMQGWMIGVATMNFVAMYLVMFRGLRFAALPSVVGAFLFSFGAPRVTQIGHQQLLPQFYSAFAILALLEIARDRNRRLWISIFFISLALQLYAGFYLGWFFGLGLLIALFWVLLKSERRMRLYAVLRADWAWISLNFVLFAAMLSPMASAYLGAARELGTRQWVEVGAMIPRFQSWFYLGPDNWIYRWVEHFKWRLPMAHEHRMGVGLATLFVSLRGLWFLKKEGRGVWWFSFWGIFLLSTCWLHDRGTPWVAVFEFVPGASAIRAVSRIGLLALIPLSVGAARYFSGRMGVATSILLLLCFAEQLETTPSYEKMLGRQRAQFVASHIPEGCEYFFYTPQLPTEFWAIPNMDDHLHLDAIWGGILAGRPTINGYSGKWPPGWRFHAIGLRVPENQERIARDYSAWLAQFGLDPARGCWLKPQFPAGS